MKSTLARFPSLSGHSWRPLHAEDAGALHQLELDCAPADGGTSLSIVEEYRKKLQRAGENLATDTLCAADSSGRLAATAWVTLDDHRPQQYRVFLDGRVHPDHRGRGLGAFVLQWMEVRALEMLSVQKEDRPSVLRLDFYDRGADAVALFEQFGFRFFLAEDESIVGLSAVRLSKLRFETALLPRRKVTETYVRADALFPQHVEKLQGTHLGL